MEERKFTDGHGELVARIAAAGRRWRLRGAAVGGMRLTTLLLAVVVPALVVDSFRPLPPWLRAVWMLGALALVLVGLWLWVFRPLSTRIDPVETAAVIEREHPELGEMLESAAELGSVRGTGRTGYSVELIDALIAQVVAETAGLDLAARAHEADRARWTRGLAVAAVACVVGLVVAGPRLGPAGVRLLHPFTAPEEVLTSILVEPGDVTLVSGDDLSVSARVDGPHEGASVAFRMEGELPLEREMAVVSDGRFSAGLENVRAPLRYVVTAGAATSPEYSVDVVERPFVTGIRLDYRFPAYSGLVPRTVDENTGDVMALAGTRVDIAVTGSKSLERSWLSFDDDSVVELERTGPATFSGRLTITRGAAYSINVVDVDGLTNSDPATYSIVAVRDENPLVRIVRPAADGDVPRDMVLPLALSAIDDYGISDISVRYAVQGRADEGVVPVASFGSRGPREVAREFDWDLSDVGLIPGSVLVYFAEVRDNDAVSGPKVSRSESYVLRFPSMAELYSGVMDEQDDIISDLDELREEQEALKAEFEEIGDEVRSDPSIDWQEQERVQKAIERQEQAAENVSEMADRMSELTDTMSESERVTMEALEKTEAITRLLDEVATEEMKDLLEQIRLAMQDLSADELSQAVDRMSVTQDDYLRRLEQTLNLLKRVKAEQQLADAADRAEQLASEEQNMADQAGADPDAEACRNMALEQDQLREQAEQLKRDIENAAQQMEQVDESAAQEMRDALKEMEDSGTIEKMNKASVDLSGQDAASAQSQCQSASNDLLALFTRMSSCQGSMSCSVNQRDRETTMRAIDELLAVSTEQEGIVSAVEDRSRVPRAEIVELVKKQTDLIEAMSAMADRTFQKSKDSFVIDPKLLRQVSAIQSMMSNAAGKIADGGTSAGYREARRALGGVNSLIVNLLSKNQGQSQGGGSAMQQLMQQLQQMAQQQSRLTDETEQLRRQLEQSGMAAGTREQMADIKARQEKMLEEARRLAQEFGDRREILGRLDKTVEDMEDAVAEMERSGASQETVDRQKRILSRLLDAQRSLRKRDYTQERRSRTGEDYGRATPGALPDELTKAGEELREDLLRAMQHEYPNEYRDLIRAYFDGLAKDLKE